MLRGGHFSGGHLTPSDVHFRAPWVGAGVDADPASGSCELDGLPAVLEGGWSGDVGEGNLLQCNFSQPRGEKKTIAGTGRRGTGGKVNVRHYSIHCTWILGTDNFAWQCWCKAAYQRSYLSMARPARLSGRSRHLASDPSDVQFGG